MESQVLSELQVLTDEQQQQVCGGGFNKEGLAYAKASLLEYTKGLQASLERRIDKILAIRYLVRY